MTPYAVDDSALWADTRTASTPEWMQTSAKEKIEALRAMSDPRKAGGAFMNRWLYPFGKFQLSCRIDDARRIVFVLRIVQLP